jgi:hypothetical protein
MNESTPITDGSTAIPAARSGLTDLKNVYGSNDDESPATDYGYGDDSVSEDDSPGGAYGYGGPGAFARSRNFETVSSTTTRILAASVVDPACERYGWYIHRYGWHTNNDNHSIYY